MKILHAASSYPLYPGDVTAPFMAEMLQALTRHGHEVAIVLPDDSKLKTGIRDGVRIVAATYAPGRMEIWGFDRSLDPQGRIRRSSIALTPLAITSMALAVRRELSRHPPDVVHLHWALPQGAIALALPDDVPIVVSVHGADAKFITGRLKPLARRIIDRADALVAASSKILDTVELISPGAHNKTRVIPHGANSSLFQGVDRSSVREQLGISGGAKVVVGVGRLVRKKGFGLLIDAMQHVSDERAELVLVGYGPDQDRLAAMAHETDAKVHLVGRATRPEVARWLAASDVVAIPSIEVEGDVDSGPVVLMEALAAGRPVVASNVGMSPDVIKDGINGYLLSATDEVALGALLEKALESSEALGQGAARTFESIGDWSRVADDLEQVYDRAIAIREGLLE